MKWYGMKWNDIKWIQMKWKSEFEGGPTSIIPFWSEFTLRNDLRFYHLKWFQYLRFDYANKVFSEISSLVGQLIYVYNIILLKKSWHYDLWWFSELLSHFWIVIFSLKYNCSKSKHTIPPATKTNPVAPLNFLIT